MRILLVLLPAVLLAQAPASSSTAPKPPAPHPAAPRPVAAAPKPAAAPRPMTDEEKTVYALGLSISRSLAQFDLTPAELDVLKQALSDAAAHKSAVDVNEWGPKIEPFGQQRSARVALREKAASVEYMAKAAAEPGTVKTASGLLFKEVRPGTGDSPKESDTVTVNYRGTLIDGTEFDSSYRRNEAAQFPLNGVIPCWTEGVQKMKPGGKATLVCPSNLAYGDEGRPSIPGGATLIFDVELISVGGAPPVQ